MTESFDQQELAEAILVLKICQERCQEIMALLDDRQGLTQLEREHVRVLYESLKNDLKEALRTRTMDGRKRPLSRVEEVFYAKAVKQMFDELMPASSSNPISARWLSAVSEAEGACSECLRSAESFLDGPAVD